jgi:cytochrome c biogenesis protein CcdA
MSKMTALADESGRRFSIKGVMLPVLLLLLLACNPHLPVMAQEPESPTVESATDDAVLWYFRRDNCYFCAQAEAWLAELQAESPMLVIHKMDVIEDPAGRDLFQSMMQDRGRQANAVPTFILADQVWVGYTRQLAAEISAAILARLDGGPELQTDQSMLDLGPLGEVNLAEGSMLAATILIAFVDGFNPCSIWVLTVLLAMLTSNRSRTRIAAVGLTFLTVTAVIYGLFIVGLFSALAMTSHLGWIQIAVALLALFVGLVNIKDYFAYKTGLSFTIPERFKPRIYRGGRAVRADISLASTLFITVLFAAGIAIIELPCTAGFPVIWTALLTESGVDRTTVGWLLGLYLLIYLSVEIIILITALITLQASRMQERHGRILKLFGGMVMLALAIILLTEPRIMESLSGSLLVVGGAMILSFLVLLVYPPGTDTP